MSSCRESFWLIALAAAAGWALVLTGTHLNAPETVDALESKLRLHPNDPDLHQRLGDALMRDQHAAQAIPHYKTAMAVDPKNAAAPYALALAHLALNQPVDAQNVLTGSLKLHPDDAATNELLAELVVQSLGRDIAMPIVQKYYETALRNDPTRAAAAIAISKLLMAQGDIVSAARVLEKPLAAHPRIAALHLQMATVLTKLKQFDAANEQFNAATVLNPNDAESVCDWGAMLSDAGRPVAAERVLRTSLDLNPRSAIAHMQLGRALREEAERDQGTFADAMKEFTLAFDLDSKYAPTYLECARAMLAMHNELSALHFLQQAVAHDPDFADALVALAQLRMTADDPAVRDDYDGLVTLKQAVDATHRKDLGLLIAFARALSKDGKFEQAAEELDIALTFENLTPVQRELIAQLKLDYEQAHLLKSEGPASVLNVDALLPHDPLAIDPWPKNDPPAPEPFLHRSLDVTHPAGPGSALDPSQYPKAVPPEPATPAGNNP